MLENAVVSWFTIWRAHIGSIGGLHTSYLSLASLAALMIKDVLLGKIPRCEGNFNTVYAVNMILVVGNIQPCYPKIQYNVGIK